MSEAARSLWLIGPGRAGLSLVLMLHRAGAVRSLNVTGRTDDPGRIRLLRDRGMRPVFSTRLEPPALPPEGVVLAVGDGSLSPVAAALARSRLPADVPVLHLSGATSKDVLAPLIERGNPVGVLHPLCPLPDPVTGSARLRGAWWGLDAEGAAAGLARWIVRCSQGRAVPIDPSDRAGYHAAAVFASNGLVALLEVAVRTMEAAGVSRNDALSAVCALAQATVADVGDRGAVDALTGPIARGDAETVSGHLARLSGEDRSLYCVLGQEALRLARRRGLDGEQAERISSLLAGSSGVISGEEREG